MNQFDNAFELTLETIHVVGSDMTGATVIPLTISIQCIQLHPSTRTRVLCGHSATVFAVFAEIAFGDNFRNGDEEATWTIESFSLNSVLVV